MEETNLVLHKSVIEFNELQTVELITSDRVGSIQQNASQQQGSFHLFSQIIITFSI